MYIKDAKQKQIVAPDDDIPAGAKSDNDAYRFEMWQIKAFCNESEGTATASTIGTVRVKLSDGKYGEIPKADFVNAMKEAMGAYCYGSTEFYASNIDNIDVPSIYTLSSGATGGPNGVALIYANLQTLCIDRSSTNRQQVLTTRGAGVWWRSMSNSAWTAWQRVDNFGYSTITDLASGVAAQMKGSGTQTAMYDNKLDNQPEKMINSGVYRIAGSAGSLGNAYGTVFVSRNSTYGFQFFVSSAGAVKLRAFTLSDGTTEIASTVQWKTITTT